MASAWTEEASAAPAQGQGMHRRHSAGVLPITLYRDPTERLELVTSTIQGGAGDRLSHQTRRSRATQHTNRTAAEWEEPQPSHHPPELPAAWASLALLG